MEDMGRPAPLINVHCLSLRFIYISLAMYLAPRHLANSYKVPSSNSHRHIPRHPFNGLMLRFGGRNAR
eukprot:scaffold239956_cov15-Prasinocladus_malaysianus.AAC.1